MKTRRNSILLIITAFIWGVAFVAQREGGDAIGPYSFNSIRSLMGAGVLVPVILLLDKLKLTSNRPETKADRKTLWIGSISCGVIMFIASNLQQMGLHLGSSAGKAGFLTACYIIVVPILGIFLKKKCYWNIWVGVVLTVIGLYLLCMTGTFTLQRSDVLLLLCAVFYSLHILVIDHFSPLVDGVRMSCIQFLVCGVLTAIPMFFVDMGHSLEGIRAWSPAFASVNAWIPLLYAGICSCGIAYTFQIIGQQDVNPTVASLLMSLESVFAVIAGGIILHERMSGRELFGCVLIFAAVILAQIPVQQMKKKQHKP